MVRVISVEALENYRLSVELSDGRKGIFDASPYLDRGIFFELKDENYFRLVRVAFGGVMWPHEQDFSADTIESDLQQEAKIA